MSEYSNFFLSASADVIQYEMLKISHPNFSQDYYLTRNAPDGVSAGGAVWTQCPMTIEPTEVHTNLDFSISITLGDVGTIIQAEMDAVRAADGNLTYPDVEYSAFASNNLASPMSGPFSLQVITFAITKEGSAFECVPQVLYRNRTGMLYVPSHFKSLRGFL